MRTCCGYSTYHGSQFPLPLIHESDEDMLPIRRHHHGDGGVLPGVPAPVVHGLLVADRDQDQLVVNPWAHTCFILCRVKILNMNKTQYLKAPAV